MERDKLKEILSNWYSDHTIDSILGGRRKPKYENILEMYTKNKIPFEVWANIKSFINPTENDTKDSNALSSAVV